MRTDGPVRSLFCPAKLNLFLEVRDRLPDGYHALGTLFQALEIGDTLQAEPWDSLVLECDMPIPGAAEDNLVLKAAALLRSLHPERTPRGIRFRLEKRLPLGAGLGGGSSDAAAALRLADAVWGLELSESQLRAAAARLGSDVAFFLGPSSAFGEGRGEVLTPAPPPYPFHVVVATPRCHVETAWAYGRIRPPYGRRWEGFKAEYSVRHRDPEFYRALHNDFEAPIQAALPEIAEIGEMLHACGPEKSLLTGSGASVFALFREEKRGRACLEAVRDRCRFSALTRFQAC